MNASVQPLAASNLPPDLGACLRDLLGTEQQWEPLGGMSGASVFRVSSARGDIVVKLGGRERELWVYRELRFVLTEHGVGLPCLAGLGVGWIALEYIPDALPGERWVADPQLIEMLHRLHSIPAHDLSLPPDRYRPMWSDDMTEFALSLLDAEARREAAERLEASRPEVQSLFAPTHLISADPNPTNWRVRHDGSLVLVDWDRLTLGAPAIDLAITVPGLGDATTYEVVASAYSAVGGSPISARELVHAKLWTVVEFLHEYATKQAKIRRETINVLVRALPEWMRNVL